MAPRFQVHLLRFRAEVTAPLLLPPAAGAALRGALFGALRQQFCLAGRGPRCGRPELAASCPVCFLLAPVDEQDRRGRDVPRPYVLRAPMLDVPEVVRPLTYAPGQHLEFELATFGRALGQFPYALLGVEEMGRQGLGARRQGQFRLDEVWAVNPLAGRQEAIYRRSRDSVVRAPSLPVDGEQVAEEAAVLARRGGDHRLRLTLVTPTRLIERDRLVKQDAFEFGPFLARLLERLSALFGRYGDEISREEGAGRDDRAGAGHGVAARPFEASALLSAAGGVRIAERRLVWRELFRASGRHGRMVPMGGLMGEVVLEGDLGPYLPWLVWGSLVHVGKDAAMGNGQFRLEAAG
ncbi:MAG: CRISPR system precrRNA processing endoribonuclease RAMP protein Cas6 [Chloroflexi bacterium]|nr:CRISPR system precrRNA processing endoribonuclease RAMP protein Cas6 [Chloroflexota bacterium]